MNAVCNKCESYIDDLNHLEQQELIENNSFVCSNCINKEMELENEI